MNIKEFLSCAAVQAHLADLACFAVTLLNPSFLLTSVTLPRDDVIHEVFLAIAPFTMLAAMVSVPSSLSCWQVLSCSLSLLHL